MRRKELILASASPRRAELLRKAGVRFRVMVSPAREAEQKPAEVPVEIWPACLAYVKAAAVRRRLGRRGDGEVILGADTIVVEGGRILNKARNRDDAREMLRSLMGRRHRVITGVAILSGDEVRLAVAEAVCRVRRMSAAWLEEYLESGRWKGKAGAYGIQDDGETMVMLESGEWSTVVGLPMKLVLRELRLLARG